MTEHVTLTGHCLCGAVEISGQANNRDVTVCHCDMCRRWSSGPYMEVTCENVVFKREDEIGRIRSSDWAERGFCKQCGSNLFYHIVGSSDYQISAGLLDDQSRLRMKLQVFTDSKPSFYDFENKTKMMTGDEVITAFTPSSG